MTTALFCGRFQPFHIGHLDAIKQILKSCDHVIIAIGSAQYARTENNPFTTEERMQMIKAALDEEGIHDFSMCSIQDKHEDIAWLHHVLESAPKFDVVYTRNPIVRKIFENAGYIVKEQHVNIDISGEKLRKMIAHDDIEWRLFIPQQVRKVMQEIKGVERIKRLVK